MMVEDRSYTKPNHWTPRTYYNELAEAAAPQAAGGVVQVMGMSEGPAQPVVDANEIMECRCGVRRPLFAFVDVRPLPETIRGDAEFACDNCWTKWIRDGLLTEAEWREYLGAPEPLVQQAQETPMFYSSQWSKGTP